MKNFFFFLCLFTSNCCIAQSNAGVGIGTFTPHTSARLDISDSAKGILIPRMTAAQRTAITSPAIGLLVYQINGTPGFYYYGGSGIGAWINLTEGVEPVSNGVIVPNGGGQASSIYATSASIINNVNTNTVTTPSTGSNNMLAVAYGTVYSNATNSFASSSGNCSISHTIGSSVYIIDFTSSNLSGTNIGNMPLMVSLYGDVPGSVVWSSTGASNNGRIFISTFNNAGTATDRGFSFVLYKP